MDFNMATRSYAGVNWLLFVRTDTDNDDVIMTALVSRGKNVVAERMVDTAALMEHGKEIGLEMDTFEFKALLLKTLEKRYNVDLRVEIETESETVKDVHLVLTYKFSPTISRKGVFRLPIVAADAPVSLVTLLTSIHAKPPYPKHFEDEQSEKVEKECLLSASKHSGLSAGNNAAHNRESGGTTTALQNTSSTDAEPALIKPGLLKKRLVPAETTRRKGPRGAKLAKK